MLSAAKHLYAHRTRPFAALSMTGPTLGVKNHNLLPCLQLSHLAYARYQSAPSNPNLQIWAYQARSLFGAGAEWFPLDSLERTYYIVSHETEESL